MYNIRLRQTFLSLYRNQSAAKEIEDVYQDSLTQGFSRSEIETAIARVISSQVSRGIFISRHLNDRGVDIRSRDMNADEKQVFRSVATKYASLVLLEGSGGKNEHWHVQF